MKLKKPKSLRKVNITFHLFSYSLTNNYLGPDEDEANYRIISVLSYFVVLVVIGLPIWWFTTRVYRANLPLEEIDALRLEFDDIEKDYGLPLSLEYDILISLVHPDPENLAIELQGELIDANLKPVLNKLNAIAEFVIKSQWLYLTDLGVPLTKVSDYYVLEENQLSHVITPLETKLWSNISPRPVINLVVYFAPCSTPLYILDKQKNKLASNAFLSPRWGGIFIMNPDKKSCESKKFVAELQPILSVFTTQIIHLLKVNNLTNSDNLKEFKVRKSNEMLLSSHRTLKSLAELLSEISSIVISDNVGEKINDALKYANWAEKLLNDGRIDDGLEMAKTAFEKSEAAFSDPSLLALLYFPEDQK